MIKDTPHIPLPFAVNEFLNQTDSKSHVGVDKINREELFYYQEKGKVIKIDKEKLDLFASNETKNIESLSELFRNNFVGTLKFSQEASMEEVAGIFQYFIRNNKTNRSFTLDMTESDFSITQIQDLLQLVESEKVIKLGSLEPRMLAESGARIGVVSLVGVRLNSVQDVNDLLKVYQDQSDSFRLSEKVVKISSNPHVALNDDLVDLALNNPKIDISQLYLTMAQTQRVLESEDERNVSLRAPQADEDNLIFMKTNIDRLGSVLLQNREYIGTEDLPITLNDNGEFKSFSRHKRYRQIDGKAVMVEEHIGTEVDDHGRVKSCSTHKHYRRIDGKAVLLEEHVGTEEVPLTFNEYGKMKSCSSVKYYQSIEGKAVLVLEWIGTKEVPITVNALGLVKSCSAFKRYQPSDGKVVLLEEHIGTEEVPTTFDDHGRPKSCSALKIYDKIAGEDVLLMEFDKLEGQEYLTLTFNKNAIDSFGTDITPLMSIIMFPEDVTSEKIAALREEFRTNFAYNPNSTIQNPLLSSSGRTQDTNHDPQIG